MTLALATLTPLSLLTLLTLPALSGCHGSGDATVDPGAGACVPGELPLADGTCRPAGIPADGCGDGFVSDGAMGCTAVLPPAACAKGQMATPGESECRDVAPCGDGAWGYIPVDATTQFVDAAYAGAGGASDGTQAKPWKTIGAAVAAAASGGMIAIAAGSYAEDLTIQSKHVRLWGRCAKLVEIVGSASGSAAVFVREGGSGTEVHDVALRGGSGGFLMSAATDVLLDRVWIHDVQARGVDVEDTLAAASATISRSLIEAVPDVGVFVMGSTATVDATVVRRTRALAGDDTSGVGIFAEYDLAKHARSSVTVRGSDVDGSANQGIYVGGSDLTVEASVVRNSAPNGGSSGRGIALQVDPTSLQRANATIRTSVIDNNRDAGVIVGGSDLTMEATVVRNTQPLSTTKKAGRGVDLQEDTAQHTQATIRGCLVEGNRDLGIFLASSELTLESTIVRGTQPNAFDQTSGRGVDVQYDATTLEPAAATLRGCVVTGNYDVGVFVASSSATIDRTLVSETAPIARDGTFGDGVLVVGWQRDAAATITSSRVATSARAGISNFGASITLTSTSLECNAIDLDGEAFGAAPYAYDLGGGGDVCGCAPASQHCQVLSTMLTAPAPI